MIEHVIPFYNMYSFGKVIRSDAPFQEKVQVALYTGSASYAHLWIFTRHGLEKQALQIATKGHWGGRTHGWGALRYAATSPAALDRDWETS